MINNIFNETFYDLSRALNSGVRSQVQKDIMAAVQFRLVHQTMVKLGSFLLEEDVKELVKYQVEVKLTQI